MRRKHFNILLNKIIRGELIWPLQQFSKFCLVPTSYYFNKPLNKPIFGGLVVTYRCNEMCPMCSVRKNADHHKEINTSEFLQLVDQFAELKISGIGITGGEPLLR
ncbi:MAG: radical SAM protein, partial [Oligoflexia bacterium]|nr:radical SAM protein [Oligoflexia bacterium]